MSTLRESNAKKLDKILKSSPEQVEMREGFKRRFGYEMDNKEKFPFEDLNLKKMREATFAKFSEADASTAFVQLLRAGVQTIVNNMYNTVPTSFESWVSVVQSKKKEELYAPLQGIGFPREIPAQGKYPETGTAGLDIKLTNRKYGSMYSVEMELNEDDQTGQIQTQAKLLGEYMKQVLEVLCMGKLASVSNMDYAGFQVPKSETQPSDESTYPWSTTLVGGGANRPAAYGALTQTNIQNAFIGLRKQKNIRGLKMAVDPRTLLISPKYEFDAAVLANSSFYPSATGALGSGTVGQMNAINPIQGKFNTVISYFMFKNDGTVDGDSTAWYLMDSSKPWFVAQIREATTVIAENPQSGASFDQDIIRFKARMRGNADFIDPRFAWQGNNGSV